jgi:hypothetical protein
MKQNFLGTESIRKQVKKKASKIGTKVKVKGKLNRPSRVDR